MAFYQEDKEKRSTDLSSADSDNQQAYSTSYACHKVGCYFVELMYGLNQQLFSSAE